MSGRSSPTEDPSGIPGTERLLALSDGVVAIALTLLVLQLKVPTDLHGRSIDSARALAHALTNDGADSFTSYVISFYVIAQFWLVHHRTYRLVSGHSEELAWLNFAFLFTITLFPFSSALLGAFPDNATAVMEFSVNLLLASLSTLAVIELAKRRSMLLGIATPIVIRGIRYRGIAIAAVIAASIVAAWFSPVNAKYIWLLLIVCPRVGSWLAGPGSDEPATPAAVTPVAVPASSAPETPPGPPPPGSGQERSDPSV